ncbi:MAG: hypothetical protein ACREON_14730, partial [Gemmatimonadaceae bacterium]
MSVTISGWPRLFWPISMSLVLTLALAGCEPEEAEVRPPEIAEIDSVAGRVEFEEAYPLTTDDIGDIILASGSVVGNPGPVGFFLRAEGNRVIFVESTQPASAGQRVRAVGPLRTAAVAVFQEWERETLGDDLEAEWEL